MGEQLLFQRAPGLDKQGAVDRLVRHVHRLAIRIPSFEPTGDLLRRPVLLELLCHHIAQAFAFG
jgi:hypothetical protein